MANPYPMQQPGMQPGMPMRPSMPMQPPMPQRRGTPKAVPIIVSAGLAVGVFCGLLFGLGTGTEEAKADTTPKDKKFVGTEIKDNSAGDHPTVEAGNPAAPPKSVLDGTKVTGTMKEPKPSPSPSASPAAGSAGAAPIATTGSAATVAKVTKVTISLKPDTIKDAKITIDGAEAKDGVLEVPLGDKEKKEVAVLIKAPGFKDFDKKMEVEGTEMKIEAELTKAHSSGGGVNAPKRPDLPGGKGSGTKKGGSTTKKGGGGLIDI